MADIGNLVVKLQAQTDAFKRKMNDAKSAVGRFSDDAKSKLAVIQKGFGVAGKAISGVIKIMTAGAGVAAGFFAAMTVKAGTIKEIQQLANVTGVAVENIQKWQFAGKAVGIETDKMGDIFRDAAEKMGELIAEGGGEAKGVFEKLGLDAKDFINLPIDQTLLKIAERMDGLTKNERNALFEMMASDARELIPLLENNAQKFRELAAEGERIGAFLSEEAVVGAVRFRERWDDLIQRAQAFSTQLMAQMAPVMEVILGKINTWIDAFGGMEQVAENAARWVLDSVKTMAKGLEALLGLINEVKLGFNTIVGTGQVAGSFISRGVQSIAGSTPASVLPGAKELERKAEMMGDAFDSVANDTAAARAQLIMDADKHSQRIQNILNTLDEANRGIGSGGSGGLTDKQLSLIETLTGKIEDLQTRIMSGENAAPLLEQIRELEKQIEETKKATSGSEKPTNDNTDATKGNTEAINTLSASIGKGGLGGGKYLLNDREPEGGFKASSAFEGLIRRFRTIAGTGQQGPGAAASFESAARTIIAQAESAGGYNTERMREQMEALLGRLGDDTKEGMSEAVKQLSGGSEKVGTLTININTQSGSVSGEVTGDPSFLKKMADALEGVAAG